MNEALLWCADKVTAWNSNNNNPLYCSGLGFQEDFLWCVFTNVFKPWGLSIKYVDNDWVCELSGKLAGSLLVKTHYY